MMRVTAPGDARTVSFQPASFASGGNASPAYALVDQILGNIERAPVQDLKAYQVKVDRMRVPCKIHQ